MFQFHRLWWSIAPCVRLDRWGRTGQVGDEFGSFWVRTVIGLDLG